METIMAEGANAKDSHLSNSTKPPAHDPVRKASRTAVGALLARLLPRPAARLGAVGLLAAMGLAASLNSAGCQSYDDATFDPRIVQRSEREHMTQPNRPILGPLPTTMESTARIPRGATDFTEPVPTTGLSITRDEARPMSLREILLRCTHTSAEVRVAGYDPAINAARVIEAEARFDPRAFANVQYARTANETAGSSIPDPNNAFGSIPLNVDRSDVYTAAFGIHQLMPSGGEARLTYQIQNSDYDPARFRVNPFWENQVKLEITQPLLQNFGTAVNAARINIARNDQRISVLDYRKTLEENLAELERDYWQLYQAQQEVTIQEKLLLETIQTYTTLWERWQRGLIDESAVRQAEVAVYARKASLIQAKQQVRDVSVDVKRRMSDPDIPVSSGEVITPADLPLVQPLNFATQPQIDEALIHRFELGQQLLRIDSAAIARQVAKNNELPKLDLVGQASFNGVDENESTALKNQMQFNHFSTQIGLNYEYPIGNREARSIYRRAVLQYLQAVEQYRNLVALTSSDVIRSLQQIDSTWPQVEARQQSRLFARRRLDLLQQQEDVGGRALTPEFVNLKLQAQEDLASAAREEAAAIANYNIALMLLERSKGTLLRYNNIVLEEDQQGVVQPKK
jgi:outer membrane protein